MECCVAGSRGDCSEHNRSGQVAYRCCIEIREYVIYIQSYQPKQNTAQNTTKLNRNEQNLTRVSKFGGFQWKYTILICVEMIHIEMWTYTERLIYFQTKYLYRGLNMNKDTQEMIGAAIHESAAYIHASCDKIRVADGDIDESLNLIMGELTLSNELAEWIVRR